MKNKYYTHTVLLFSAILTGIVLSFATAGEKPEKNTRKKNPAREKKHQEFATAASLRLAIKDLMRTFPKTYPNGRKFLERLKAIEKDTSSPAKKDASSANDELLALAREALLANPLLDFGRLMLVKRPAQSPRLGLPQNWSGNCALPRSGYDDEIVMLSPLAPDGKLTTVFKPDVPKFIGDVDLNVDGKRLLFSMLGSHNRWQIWEVGTDGKGLRQVTQGLYKDVDNYDPCYLPDGRIIFGSTRCFAGVPCVGGSQNIANLYKMDANGSNVRQLCFDQEHDWCPVVLENGRVMYTRWEYTDTPHYFTRLLMEMNPDGTSQMERYGSNSFWPNSLFYARPIPGHPDKLAAIVSGHHGEARMGEFVLLDLARGRRNSEGVVQRIPGYKQPVQPLIQDRLVARSWPRFLHPYPLSDTTFLVASQPTSRADWGIYLVDIFDNMTCIKSLPGYALMEPFPLRSQPRPPVIPDKVQPDRKDAIVYMEDVYEGGGLDGVPRGTIKKLRVFEYHYSYQGIGGHRVVGVESSWEPKRILGTVPVAPDGSAMFRIPANTPISIQPLDNNNRAVQLMQSWMTAMPGEVLSCVGCHEGQNRAPSGKPTLSSRRAPDDLTPWYGPARGFSFVREVQPVLDQYCASCHDGRPADQGGAAPNLTDTRPGTGKFTQSYLALHPYVRRPGPESDYKLSPPMSFHASASELIQILEKGHYGVHLDTEAWDRLATWIDLNAPDIGTWTERYGKDRIATQHRRRMEMRKLYAGVETDPEYLPALAEKLPPQAPHPLPKSKPDKLHVSGWPFPLNKARSLQAQATDDKSVRVLDLGGGVRMEFVRIPSGQFIMGSQNGSQDEYPRAIVQIDRPFWMSKTEISNEQFARFAPHHDSRYIDQQHKDHTTPGYPVNRPQQPVVRVSWQQAVAFCDWLGRQTKTSCQLPSEAEWEWACRSGTETAFPFGPEDVDFSTFANLADQMIRNFAVRGVNPKPIPDPSILDAFIPKDNRFNDRQMVTADVGSYAPNAWGLHDMNGNAAEWTRSIYRAYPYRCDDDRNDPDSAAPRTVRGGSWRDRPFRATSSYRLAYEPWQSVFNVGFRIIFY